MKIFKSRKWKLKALLIVVGIILSFLGSDPDQLFAFVQYREKYCSDDAIKNLKAQIIFPGAGHWVPAEYPQQVNEALLAFVKKFAQKT